MKALNGSIKETYIEHLRQKIIFLVVFILLVFIVGVYAIFQGAYEISVKNLFLVVTGHIEGTYQVVVLNIRFPRIIAAVICGWGLSLSGVCIQSILKNPLGSPSTLGISQGAAFGAAAAIVVFGTKVFSVTAFAFGGAITATVVVLVLSGVKRLSSEAVILAGVALSSLFVSATILIQYLATETELAKVVFWTFGDVARSNWREIGVMAGVVFFASFYLLIVRWDLNAMASGEETAKGLGVNVEKLRVTGMMMAALVSAMATAFHGVIAFIGLIAPHIARRLVGNDHRLLIPYSSALGALLLLASDTIGRIIIGSGAMPVGVITSFLGAPMFLYLLIRGYR